MFNYIRFSSTKPHICSRFAQSWYQHRFFIKKKKLCLTEVTEEIPFHSFFF